MNNSYYDTAQICLNGHVVNTKTGFSPQSNQNNCSECGAKTITACVSCGAPIRGYYHVPGVMGIFKYDKPSYCHNCGEAYTPAKKPLLRLSRWKHFKNTL